MLGVSITKNGTGFSIYGDYLDLLNLHSIFGFFIHYPLYDYFELPFSNFSHYIRHSKENRAETTKVPGFTGFEKRSSVKIDCVSVCF